MAKDLISKGTYVEYYPNETKRIVCAAVKSVDTNEVLARGFSKCAEQDSFDLEFGKKIAKFRAYEKLGEKYMGYYNKRIARLLKEIDGYNEILCKLDVETSIYDVCIASLMEEKYHND